MSNKYESGAQPEQEKNFSMLTGFSDVKDFGNEPSTIQDYKAQGLEEPKPGTYSINNGTIAIATSEGKIGVWIPKSDTRAPRTISFEQAMASLEDAGYKESKFYVPLSNE